MKTLLLGAGLICSVLLIGGAVFVVQETIRSADEVQARSMVLHENDDLNARAARILKDTERERALVDAFVLQPDGAPRALELMARAAARAKVQASVGDLRVTPVSDGLQQLTATISAEGSFAAHARFLAALNALPTASALSSLSLEATESGWYGMYTISFVQIR